MSRLRVFVASIVALATASAGTVALGAIPAGAASASRVPVIVCPTAVGFNNPQSPVASSAQVPPSAANLVLYSSTSGDIQVLGPKNLACQASLDVDGNASITLTPPYPGYRGIGNGHITVSGYPACQGCILLAACPFFPEAMQAEHTTYPAMQCTPQPVGQVTRRLSSLAVAFSDPAGEYVPEQDRNLVPSDSPYPTNGVVAYGSSALEAVCVLPASEHAVCTAVLNYFLTTQVKKWMPAITTAPLPMLDIPPAHGLPGYSGWRPTTVASSADGGNIVGGISWSSWRLKQAVGHGTVIENNCIPDCAQGQKKSEPVTLTLSNPKNGWYRTITESVAPYRYTTVYTYGSQMWPLGAG